MAPSETERVLTPWHLYSAGSGGELGWLQGGGGERNTAKRKGVGRRPPPQGKYVRIGKVGQRKGIQFVKSLQRGIGGDLFCL